MIAKLSGQIDTLETDSCIIDVNGVGYGLQISQTTAQNLVEGNQASLYVEMLVRQDAINLIGFLTKQEQRWFRLLTTVQGLGTKVALSLLSRYTPDQLSAYILNKDQAALTQADGVGPKLATRILTELRDKALMYPVTKQDIVLEPRDSIATDLVSALVGLGYKPQEATSVARDVITMNPSLDLAALIRLALPKLALHKGVL